MGISPLRFAKRTCRLTPLIIVGGTSGAIFFSAIAIIRFSCASEDATGPPRYTSCFERPKNPLLGEAGRLLEGANSLLGWPDRPPPETGQCHARNVQQSGLSS